MSLATSPSRVLQRVVFPADRDPAAAAAVLPLYLEGGVGADQVTGRRGCRVGPGSRVSFGAYFNAFPAGYWQRWTDLDDVTLRVDLTGSATVDVYGSDAQGRVRQVAARTGTGDAAPVEVRVPLTGFDDGGWLWFEVAAAGGGAEIRSAEWASGAEATAPRSTASLGITTYNRVAYCLGLLRRLGEDPALLDVLDAVYVVDQGEDRVSASPEFASVTAALGDRLRVVEQPNLGGSGGFARAQLETVRAGRSDHLVILDDDIVLEPESILRALAFADHCAVPTLVGAHMFSLPEPTRLHAMAECVDLRRFRWGPKDEDRRDHDLAAAGLRGTPWLHRREDVNYNGWWMCLIPRQVLERAGLSLPFFIRWDDAEYGLRAGAAGFPTVTLPGVAVWHVPWTHKTDALDWQAYFHQRNRVISALLHSPYDHGGLLVPELLLHQVKHLAAMQYSTAQLRLQAIADVLDGPHGLHAGLATKPAQVRALRSRYPDADVRAEAAEFPPPAPAVARGAGGARRTGRWLSAAAGVARQLRPVPAASRRTPQAHLRAAEAHWSELLKYDSAVVSTADSTGAVWYRRDRAMFLGIARRSLVMHRRLHREWPRLAAEYRAALADLTSPEAWQTTFESKRSGA